eukprot:4379843-Amphidinium_carterae.1
MAEYDTCQFGVRDLHGLGQVERSKVHRPGWYLLSAFLVVFALVLLLVSHGCQQCTQQHVVESDPGGIVHAELAAQTIESECDVQDPGGFFDAELAAYSFESACVFQDPGGF